ncbi:MAG: hypothetical protein J6I76_18230 [Oribacterium sp.]|nr:hypothetical protein [Oribacterium sp.]
MILPFLAGVKYKGKIYFSMRNGNGLFSYNPAMKETVFLTVFSKEKICDFLHLRAFLYKNEMWLVPLEGDYISCVNLDSLEIQYFEVFNRDRNSGKHLFYSVVLQDDYAFFLPNQTDTIMKVNLNSKKCEALYTADYLKSVWAIDGFVQNDILNVVRGDGDVGLKINIYNGNIIYENTQSNGLSFHSCMLLGDECWMIPRSGDIRHGRIINNGDIIFDEKNIHTDGGGYYRGAQNNNKLIFFPCDSNKRFVVFDTKSDDVIFADGLLEKYKPNGIWFECNIIDADEGCWATTTNGAIIDFTDLDNVKTYGSVINDNATDLIFWNYKKYGMIDRFLENNIVTESKSIINLDMFIDNI